MTTTNTASRKFIVSALSQQIRVFDTAAEAVRYGASKCYLPWTLEGRMIAQLESGNQATWSYGFMSVDVTVQP